MTEREPSRERFLQLRCEHCSAGMSGPGIYMEDLDEYWCDNCADNYHEAAYDRHQESLMENGPGPSLRDQQEAARKLK